MKTLKQDPAENPYEIREGYIHLSEELERNTGYPNPIMIVEIGDLARDQKFDQSGYAALKLQGGLTTTTENLSNQNNSRKLLLSLLVSELVGTPVSQLEERPYSIPAEFTSSN